MGQWAIGGRYLRAKPRVVIVFPPAKVNIGLNVVRKRADGYHDIETVMLPVPLCDGLEAVVDRSMPDGTIAYTRSGLPIEGPETRDLVMRAHGLLSAKAALPGLRLHLHKRIPTGAGLGGGSSDGAHALMLLEKLLALSVPKEELHAMALALGSDCPFFLAGGAQLAKGKGEVLEPVSLDLVGYWLVLVNPGIAVPTAEVYAHMKPTGASLDMARLLGSTPMNRWREAVPNVMEEHVFRTRPVVRQVFDLLVAAGAEHAAMSGSGSTVYALFKQRPPELAWPPGHQAWISRLGQ